MGNLLGRKQVVHPLLNHDDHDELASLDHPSDSLWVKVRLTASQLQELTAKADSSQDNSDLGRLILQECLEGRLAARVVPASTIDVEGNRCATCL
ncbi:hypothetical protein ACOSQ3_000756 [Xanthoceras sorbifolium]